jgi:hypothetical protein
MPEKRWGKRMGTGSTLSGFAKLPIPNPFKYILKFRRKSLSKNKLREAGSTWPLPQIPAFFPF